MPMMCASMRSRPLRLLRPSVASAAATMMALGCPGIIGSTSSKSSAWPKVPLASAASSGEVRRFVARIGLEPEAPLSSTYLRSGAAASLPAPASTVANVSASTFFDFSIATGGGLSMPESTMKVAIASVSPVMSLRQPGNVAHAFDPLERHERIE
jgi:hypothetical protein